MLVKCHSILFSSLLFILTLKLTNAWYKSFFYIDSRLPKECGHSKSFSPENYFEYWGFWPWLGVAYYNGTGSTTKSNAVLIHPQVAISSLDFFKYIPEIDLKDHLYIAFSLPGLPSFQNVSGTHIDFTGDSYNTGSSVAMIRLSKALIISANVQPICLWEEDYDYSLQLKAHYAILVGADLELLFTEGISSLRIYQAPVRVIAPEKCYYEGRFDKKNNTKAMCIQYYKPPINCHGIGSKLILPRVSETGAIVWYLRGMMTARHWHCEKYNDPWIFDIASIRPWIESHFRPSTEKRCGRRIGSHTALVTMGNETQRGDWPWHAALFLDNALDTNRTYRCGGSLISDSYVLTAGHCVYSGTELLNNRLSVKLGKYDLSANEKNSKDIRVSEIIPHESYSSETLRHDIALLLLATKVKFNKYIQPVCLWFGDDTNKQLVYNQIGRVPGWGLNEQNIYSNNLYIATIPIVDDIYCYQSHATFYDSFLTRFSFCAGNPRGSGSGVCNGDSGGGLVLPVTQDDQEATWYLRGIVSVTVRRNNRNICDPDYYAIYTDVAKYLDWIKFQTTILE